ncbi:MAG: hypothetical protein KA146_02010 [Leptospiraceae bacterium]|nr:hypothetical protein [Leptospiraceae bacterium]
MELSKLTNTTLPESNEILSNIYEMRMGRFGIEKDGLRTFLCSSKVVNLREDLQTFEKLTLANSWPISQTIQREIDPKRIQEIEKNYIQSDVPTKYFPPITVVLLPQEKTTKRIAKQYNPFIGDIETIKNKMYNRLKDTTYAGKENEEIKKLILNSSAITNIDGIYALNVIPLVGYSILCWDRTKIYAIVIDGQHRLESLKKAMDENPEVGNYSQDIVFLDLTSNQKISSLKISPVETVRSIFIDINHTAKQVPRSKKIIMEDRELACLLVQTIVDDSRNDLEVDRISFIRPELIDWHTSNLKHELPYITSIILLWQLMYDYFLQKNDLDSFEKYRKKNKVKDFVRTLNTKLLVDSKIEKEIKYSNSKIERLKDSLEKYLKNLPKDENDDDESAIFEFDFRTLDIAIDNFKNIYLNAMVSFFTDLYPYKFVIEFLNANGAFDETQTLRKLILLSPSKREKEKDKNKNENGIFADLKEKILRETSKNWLFHTVLGQKSMFSLFNKHLDLKVGGNLTKEKVNSEAREFLDQWNIVFKILNANVKSLFSKEGIDIPKESIKKSKLIHLGVHSSKFWEDIIYAGDILIYNTQGINSLSHILKYIFSFVIRNQNAKSLDEIGILDDEFKEFDNTAIRNKAGIRIVSENLIDEEKKEETISELLKLKHEFLKKYLSDCIIAFNNEYPHINQ